MRPGIVVEASGLFGPKFPNVLVVPCTTKLTTEVASLCVAIEPDENNGFVRPTWAVSHNVMSASKQRIVRETTDFVTQEQVAKIRSQIAEALDI